VAAWSAVAFNKCRFMMVFLACKTVPPNHLADARSQPPNQAYVHVANCCKLSQIVAFAGFMGGRLT
jgi:hypothetical protein